MSAVWASALARGSLYGLQFHPEKSSEAGLRLLSNFIGLVVAGNAAAMAVEAA